MDIASLLFGISASLDALLVGVSYGIRGVRIRLWQNLCISSVTLLGTCLSVVLGQRAADFLPETISRYGGSVVLMLLGIYYITKWICSETWDDRSETLRECSLAQNDCRKAPLDNADRPKDGLHSAAKDAAPAETTAASKSDVPPCLSLAEVFTLSLTLSLNNVSAGLSASLAGLSLVPTAIATFVCSVLFLFSGSRLGRSSLLQLAGRAADPLSGILLIGLGLLQFFL